GTTALHYCASNIIINMEVVRILIGKETHLLNLQDINGQTLLHRAILIRNSKAVKELLALGANPLITYTYSGQTALELAYTTANEEIIKAVKESISKTTN